MELSLDSDDHSSIERAADFSIVDDHGYERRPESYNKRHSAS